MDIVYFSYILNRGWVDKDSKKVPTYKDIVGPSKAKKKSKDTKATEAEASSASEDEADDEEEQSAALGAVLGLLAEQHEVDLEDGLEEAHVGALVKADLMLPEVDNENFGRGEGEQSGFALEVLGSRGEKEGKRAYRCNAPGPRRALVRLFPQRP